MRILHILGSLAVGGAENFILDMLKDWHDEKNAAGSSSNFIYDVVYENDSPEYRVRAFSKFANSLRRIKSGSGFKVAYNIAGIISAIRENDTDLIHVHNLGDAVNAVIAAFIYKAMTFGKRDVPVVMTVHGLNLDVDSCGMLKRMAIRNLSKIVFVSRSEEEYYLSKPSSVDLFGMREGKTEIIYNGIDSSKIESAKAADFTAVKNELFESLNPPHTHIAREDIKVFLMVGNFNTEVRLQHMLCEAMLEYKKEYGFLPFLLLFAGGANRSKPELFNNCVDFCVKNGLSSNIKFLGQREDAYSLMKGADYYIYASAGDSYGLTIEEALCAGCKVLCSDIQSFRELYGDMAHMFPNSVAGAKEAIREAAEGEMSFAHGVVRGSSRSVIVSRSSYEESYRVAAGSSAGRNKFS